jgi:hypothetical protein
MRIVALELSTLWIDEAVVHEAMNFRGNASRQADMARKRVRGIDGDQPLASQSLLAHRK